MIKHKATMILNGKGWNVNEACIRWGMRIATFNARCNNPSLVQQLEDMCNGLKDRLNEKD